MLQSVTVLSTTEVEYMALAEASKETVWLGGLAWDFRINQGSVMVKSDSQSIICLVSNQVFHGRTKHIEERYHRIRYW